MKKILLFFVFIVISIVSLGQNTQYFNKLLFPNISTNSLQSVIKADSNYFVLYGWLDTPYVDKQGLGILKLDLSGNIIKSKLIKDSTLNYFNYPGNSLIYTTDSCLIIAGVLEDTLYKDHSVLIKINKNLDIIWTKEFSHPDTIAASQTGANVINTFTAVRQTYDGGYIIAGNYNPNCNTTYNNMYLLKTDSLGNFQWIKKFPNTDNSFDIEITSDSGFVFPSVPNYGMDLIKTDKLGNYQWTMHYDNNYRHRIGHDIEILDENTLIIGSQYIYLEDYDYGYPNALDIAKINFKTKQLIWEKKHYVYGNLRSILLHQSIRLKKQSNGNVVISGTAFVVNPSDTNEIDYKGVMVNLNSNGDSLWIKFYGIGAFEDDCQFNDMLLTDDGGFLAVGYHYAYHPGIMYQDAWIVKMDSLGCDTPGCQSVGIKSAALSRVEGLIVYPNPAILEIMIYNQNNSFLPEGVLKLFNQEGKLIEELEVPKGQQSINIKVEHLASGLYFGRINNEKGKSWSFRFVKE